MVSISVYCSAEGSAAATQLAASAPSADFHDECQAPLSTASMGGAAAVSGLTGDGQSIRSGARTEATYRRLDLLRAPHSANAQEPAGSASSGEAGAARGREPALNPVEQPQSRTADAATDPLATEHVCDSRADQCSRVADSLCEPWARRVPGARAGTAQRSLLERLLCCSADALGEQEQAARCQNLSAHALTARGVVSSARSSGSRGEARRLSTLTWVGVS